MKNFTSICFALCTICIEAMATIITTDVSGWTFTEAEPLVFKVEEKASFVVRDWREREVASGAAAQDGVIRLAPLPPGYYRGECGGEKFTFCVVTTNRCRSADSFFAADSALSGCTSTTPAEPRSANRSSRHTRVSGIWRRSSSCGSRAGSRQGRRKT